MSERIRDPQMLVANETAYWDFTDLPGLVLYLDNANITNSGGKTTAWPNLGSGGGSFVQASPVVQPNYIDLETDFPTPQPAVKCNVSGCSLNLVNASFSALAWIAVVAIYPATTFSGSPTLIAANSVSSGTDLLLRGKNATANWQTLQDTVLQPATRYRDGAQTDVALTTANTPHLYEAVLTTPWVPNGGLQICRAGTGDQWGDSIGLVLGTSFVPTAGDLVTLVARCRLRGLIP